MNIGSKFILSIVSIATLAVASTAAVIATLSSVKTEEVLLEARQDQMISLRNVATQIVQQYFESIGDQVLSISQQQAVIDATRNFSTTSKSFPFFVGRKDREAQRAHLANYYSQQIAGKYNQLNPSQALDGNDLVKSMNDATLALQDQYIANNTHELESKDELLGSNDVTSYTSNHKNYHPYFRAFLQRSGLQDILLLNADTGNVVYSVKKYIDFGTSVTSGKFSQTGLAAAFNQAKKIEGAGFAFIDYSPYLGTWGLPTAFISAPVYEKGKLTGVVVFALSSANLTKLITYGYNWKASGLGNTGETYLIGTNKTPRSTSRQLLETPDVFRSEIQKLNYNESVINKIIATKTNVAIQPIESDAIANALNGDSGVVINKNYLNKKVLTAYAPIEVMGMKWALLNEIEMDEVVSKLSEIQKFILLFALVTAVVVIVLGGIAGLLITKTIVRPLQVTSHSLIDIAEGEGDLTSRLDAQRKDELGELATGFNQFVGKIHNLVKGIQNSVGSLTSTVADMNAVTDSGRDAVNTQYKETEMVAAAVNQMAASAQEVANNATHAAEVAHNADAEGKHVQSVVEKAITSIEDLSQEIDQASLVISELEGNVGNIVKILDVIRGIAEQTNLLALNAAIESARAGEHGRGFAVVADEVRALAKKTQDSTEEIQGMIEKLEKDSGHAVTVMTSSKSNGEKSAEIARQVGVSLIKIAEAISEINDMNTQIASASSEQKQAIEEINCNIVNISHSGEKTLNGMSSIANSSEALKALSDSLNEQVKQFKV